jgi:hypothetical protein
MSYAYILRSTLLRIQEKELHGINREFMGRLSCILRLVGRSQGNASTPFGADLCLILFCKGHCNCSSCLLCTFLHVACLLFRSCCFEVCNIGPRFCLFGSLFCLWMSLNGLPFVNKTNTFLPKCFHYNPQNLLHNLQ